MYNVTSDYKRDILKPNRYFDAAVTIGNKKYTNTEIIKFEHEGGIQSGDAFSLGTVVAKMAKITLRTDNVITEDMEITPKIALWVEREKDGVLVHEWEWVPMGTYYIDDLEAANNNYVITAYDAMIKTETVFDMELTEQNTLLDVSRFIKEKTGISFADSIPAIKVKPLAGSYSIRDVLGFIASIMGGCMTVARDGRFKVVKLTEYATPITGHQYFKFKPKPMEWAVGKITCEIDKDTSISSGTLEVGTHEMNIENPWIDQNTLDGVMENLTGFSYAGYELSGQGNPAIDPGDRIIVTDTNNIKHDIPVLHYKMSYAGGLKMDLSAESESENKSKFSSSGGLTKELEKIEAQQGIFNELVTESLKAHDGYFDQLKAGTGDFGEIFVRYGEFDKILGNSAIFQQVQADAAKFGVIEGDVAILKTLVNGNITSENIQSLVLSVGKVTAQESFVKTQIAAQIYVQDLLAGDISTNKFRIISDSGRLLMQDNTIQIRDAARVRVQIGKDASGDYSMYVWDASGALMFDALGLKASGIKDKIIRDDMVSDNANINGSKIDMVSLITEINNGTTNITSSKILYDPTGQTLNVAFNLLQTSVTGLTTTVSSHETSITAIQGSIAALISDTTIVEDGQSKKLKDAYSSLKLTVNGLSSTVGTHTSQIGDIDGKFSKYVTTESMKSAIDQSASGVLTTVSQTYVTEKAMGDAFAFYWSASETATAINQTAKDIRLTVSETYATKDSVNGLSTRVSSTELALEPDKIVAKVQSGISDKNGKIQTANYILDATGFRIYNGAFQMYKGTGGAVEPSLYFDTMMDRYVFSGHIVANTGSFGGALSAASGTFGGSVEIYNGTRPLYKLNSSGLNVYASQVAVEGFQVGSMYDYYNSTAFAFEIRNPQSQGHLRLSAGSNIALITGQYGFMMQNGQKSRAVSTDYGIACINAYETPEPSFGDYGSGALDRSGECVIFIDPVFIQTVSPECGYQVFVQKYGQGDIWVEERNQDNFIIKGTPGLKFGWNAVFHQKGYELDRAEIVDIPIDNYSETFTDEALSDQIDYEKEAYEYLQEVS